MPPSLDTAHDPIRLRRAVRRVAGRRSPSCTCPGVNTPASIIGGMAMTLVAEHHQHLVIRRAIVCAAGNRLRIVMGRPRLFI